MSAPSAKLPASAIARRTPSTPSESPPSGKSSSWVPSIRPAASSSATPMPIWMLRRGQLATTPAPSQAPATAAAIISTRVRMSTLTIEM